MPRAEIPSSRLSLGHLTILVAATGAGLAMFRPYLASFAGPGMQYFSPAMRTVEITYGAWSILAAWWMVALLILRYRHPHPSRGWLARRPGHVACCAAVVALGVGGLDELTRLAASHHPAPFSFSQLWITLSVRVGPTIAGAWLLLALSGRWRSDRGWMDRLGRFLGSCWIGWILFWLLPDAIRSRIPPIWDGVLR